MKKKNILLICQYFPPDITAAAYRLGNLAEYLQEKNFNVTVLSTHPHKVKSNHTLGKTNFTGDHIRVVRVRIMSRHYVGQYFKFVLAGLVKIFPLALKNRPDIVFVSSPPLSVFLIGFIVSRLKRSILVTDIRDLWPDTPAALGKMKADSRLFRFFKRYERWMYRRSHRLTCVSRPMQQKIQGMVETGDKVHVFYNGITQREFERARHTSLAAGVKGKKFRVYYYGNIGLAQGLDILLQIGRQLENRLEFHLIGDGALKKKYMEEAAARKIGSLFFHDSLPRDELFAVVNREADILFINLVDQPVFHLTIPSKIFDYLLHRLPVIGGISGEGREILSRTGAAVFFNNSRNESIIEAFNHTVDNYPQLLASARENNFRVAADFIREKNSQALIKLFEKN